MSSPLRALVHLPLMALVIAACGGSDTPHSTATTAPTTSRPAAPATLDMTSGELVAQVTKLLPKVAPGIEALYVVAVEPGGDGPKTLAGEVRATAEAALRRAYRLPRLRLIDTYGQGIACGATQVANASGDAVPYGLGLVADVVAGQAWLARSSDMCMAVAYDHKDPAAVGASPTGRVIGRLDTPTS